MNNTTPNEGLKLYFGYEQFRPRQEEIIQAILAGKDVLVLMPTGGGKSICFQLPALLMKGCGVVISPLISLMKDQVGNLTTNGIKAAYLNSSQPAKEQHLIEGQLYKGALDLLYISPEKLASPSFLSILQSSDINLFAIDEAHCISSWGHDFRKDYTRLKFLKRDFPKTPITAFTATADELTRQDILQQLGLKDPKVVVTSFDRPNLSISVRSGQNRITEIQKFIQLRPDQSGIIYCLSRKSTERVAEALIKKGIKANFYHAGMAAKDRLAIQEAFVKDELQIIVATIAFGMGIDKSNVRWVIHYNLPKNLEGYYQEIGRAGRDGVASDTLLFYNIGDYYLLEQIIKSNESNNQSTQLEKLKWMKQFAEALTCRRRLLLHYFGEQASTNCGNCDVCQNPPKYMDGTQIAQMALSAVYRLREQASMNQLIDVLRGSKSRTILEKKYHLIKTYGVGKAISAKAWQFYFIQFINLGLLKIASDQNNIPKLTDLSRRVLFKNESIQLVAHSNFESKKKTSNFSQKRVLERDLFRQLKQLRRSLAQKEGIPPYFIFNDATLEKMAQSRPQTERAFLRIPGVAERKLEKFGAPFLESIKRFVQQYPDYFSTNKK